MRKYSTETSSTNGNVHTFFLLGLLICPYSYMYGLTWFCKLERAIVVLSVLTSKTVLLLAKVLHTHFKNMNLMYLFPLNCQCLLSIQSNKTAFTLLQFSCNFPKYFHYITKYSHKVSKFSIYIPSLHNKRRHHIINGNCKITNIYRTQLWF